MGDVAARAQPVDGPGRLSGFSHPAWAVLEAKVCADAGSTNVMVAQSPWVLGFPDDSRVKAPEIRRGIQGSRTPNTPSRAAPYDPAPASAGRSRSAWRREPVPTRSSTDLRVAIPSSGPRRARSRGRAPVTNPRHGSPYRPLAAVHLAVGLSRPRPAAPGCGRPAGMQRVVSDRLPGSRGVGWRRSPSAVTSPGRYRTRGEGEHDGQGVPHAAQISRVGHLGRPLQRPGTSAGASRGRSRMVKRSCPRRRRDGLRRQRPGW
jgi:hypothetical protein